MKGFLKNKNRRYSLIRNIVIAISILLLWEFLLSNQATVDRINGAIQALTGRNLELRAFSSLTLPKPSAIVKELIITPTHGRGGPLFFWTNTRTSLIASIEGFIIGNFVAISMAVLFLYVRPLERGLMPLALALRSVPLVALTPIFLRLRFSLADAPMVQENPVLNAIFGTPDFIKLVIVLIVVFFPTLVNVFRGLQSIDESALELMRSLNASEWNIFWKLRMPSALPLTFSALKIGAGSSVTGVVVAEWLASGNGLGNIMATASMSATLTTASLWVAVLLSTSLAYGLYSLVSLCEKLAIPWHESVIALKEILDSHEGVA